MRLSLRRRPREQPVRSEDWQEDYAEAIAFLEDRSPHVDPASRDAVAFAIGYADLRERGGQFTPAELWMISEGP